MGLSNFQQIVATKGDLAFKAAGVPVFLDDERLNIKVGEPVLYLPEQNLTIAPASIEKGTKWTFAIGGSSKNKKSGVADKLIIVGGSDFNLNDDRFNVHWKSDCCGEDQIVDVYMSGCVECNESYPIALTYEDQYTRRRVATKDGDVELVLTGTNNCKTECGTCLSDGSAFQIALSWLKDLYNQKNGTASIPGFGEVGQGGQNYVPIFAGIVEKGRKIYSYCLTPASTACATCTQVNAINSITFERNGEGQEDLVLDQTNGLQNFNISGKTSLDDLPALEKMISKFLAPHNMWVKLNQSQSACCKIELQFMGCFDGIIFSQKNDANNANVTINVSDVYDPFVDPIVIENGLCTGCTTTSSTFDSAVMVRFIIEGGRYDCPCEGLPEVLDLRKKRIIKQIQPLGAAWNTLNFYVKNYKLQTYAQGEGIFYYHAAINTQHKDNNSEVAYYRRGLYGEHGTAPGKTQYYDHSNNVECQATYCECALRIDHSYSGDGVLHSRKTAGHKNVLLIVPKADTTTITSIQTLWTRLAVLSACNIVGQPCGSEIPDATGVTVLPSTLALEVGDTSIATATVAPTGSNQNGTWTTSDAGVATVSTLGGDITAIAAGTATITFTSEDGSFTDTVAVTVS